jgi:hypothetical protein
MMKSFFFLYILIGQVTLWACPYCAGNTQNGKDNNTTLILGLFILACYIPYWVIYRLIKKGRGTQNHVSGN